MSSRIWRCSLETFFVLGIMISLKTWVFPFFIHLWFQGDPLAETMLEWTILMIAMMTCFVYLGLGSSSKQTYGLSWILAVGVFLIHHVPFWILFYLSWGLGESWSGLLGDGLALFFPDRSIHLIEISGISFLLYCFGRMIRVTDAEWNQRDRRQSPMSAQSLK